MWLWLISSIAGGILGGATDSWFAKTKVGIWFYKTVDNIYTWTAKMLHIKIIAKEEKWRKKYPNITKQMDKLEKRLESLEKLHHDDGK